jgi:hypothetical protein
VIEATQFEVSLSNIETKSARCGRGEVAMSGGIVQSGAAQGVIVGANGPVAAGRQPGEAKTGDLPKRWLASVTHSTSGERTFRVFAICAPDTDARLVTRTVTLDSSEAGRMTMECGRGEQATGGGAIDVPFTAGSVTASGPLDGTGIPSQVEDGDVSKGWFVEVVNGGPDDTKYQGAVVCTRKANATIEATAFALNAGQTGEASALCPADTSALGGGLLPTGDTSSVYMSASGPLDASGTTLNTDDGDVARQWYGAALNPSGSPKSFSVLAICA